MLEIAHRGYSERYKDNSKEAIIAAKTFHFDLIEIDVQLTYDKKIILFHDIYINKKLIENLTLEKIKKEDKTILEFSELKNIIDISKTKICLDIKGTNKEICNILYQELDKQFIHNYLLSSFNFPIMEELYKINPNLNLGLISSNIFSKENFIYFLSNIKIKFVCLHWTALEQDIIDFLHEKNVMVFTYTCKNSTIYNFIKNYDIDGIVTNEKLYLLDKKPKNKENKDINNYILILITILCIFFFFYK